ncbi:MAG: hypothetical protein BMS9Abin37_2044 [Acidobacteriota bacterium]|nr:MAG: hypothetical protein BMS9Abin37_2044 [Acidobacteriota bacterium]
MIKWSDASNVIIPTVEGCSLMATAAAEGRAQAKDGELDEMAIDIIERNARAHESMDEWAEAAALWGTLADIHRARAARIRRTGQ